LLVSYSNIDVTPGARVFTNSVTKRTGRVTDDPVSVADAMDFWTRGGVNPNFGLRV
jgi:hypothetical protein